MQNDHLRADPSSYNTEKDQRKFNYFFFEINPNAIIKFQMKI